MLIWLLVAGLWLRSSQLSNTSNDFNSQVVLPTRTIIPSTNHVDEVRVIVGGDVMPGRMVNVFLQQIQDFDYPFKNDLFNNADIVFVNLESPLIDNCPLRHDGFKFCSDKRIARALAKTGVSIVNLANNHISNEGSTGILQTRQYLDEAGVLYTGTDQEVVVVKKGIRFGFLGFNDVGGCPKEISCADTGLIQKQIKELSEKVDVIIVQFHWGTEYINKPTKRQTLLAHAAIEAGADLVVGAHPHWVQSTEVYQDVLIAYSHGNLLFDQQWSLETQQGVLGNYFFTKDGLKQYEFMPIIIDRSYQPRFATDDEKKVILNRMGIQ